MTECPKCGQPMRIRCGVTLQPKKAELFDMIEQTSRRGGVELETLAWVFYPGVPTKTAKDRIKVHINQLNDQLCETDWCVVNDYGLYRLVKRAQSKTQQTRTVHFRQSISSRNEVGWSAMRVEGCPRFPCSRLTKAPLIAGGFSCHN